MARKPGGVFVASGYADELRTEDETVVSYESNSTQNGKNISRNAKDAKKILSRVLLLVLNQKRY